MWTPNTKTKSGLPRTSMTFPLLAFTVLTSLLLVCLVSLFLCCSELIFWFSDLILIFG